MQYLVLMLMIVALVIALIIEFVMHHKSLNKLMKENKNYQKKVIILETANQFLKSTVKDLQQAGKNDLVKRALLVKENRELKIRLDNTMKKMSALSKVINDMKNS